MLKTLTVFIFMLLVPAFAFTEELPVKEIEIVNNRFVPSEIPLTANQKFKIIVKNKDQTPEEFESYELNREKVVAPNSEISLLIGPLSPGEYKFFGEFHSETAQGKFIVSNSGEGN